MGSRKVPPCFVKSDSSPTYRTLLSRLKKEFPHVEDDVNKILPEIAQDFRHARHADSIPRFNDTLFKYRVPSSDQRRGTRGGFRLCAYYDKQNNTLYPVLIWPKSEDEDLDYEIKAKAVKELLQIIELPPPLNF